MKYFIMVDCGEFESEWEIKKENLTLEYAKKEIAELEKQGLVYGSNCVICVEM